MSGDGEDEPATAVCGHAASVHVWVGAVGYVGSYFNAGHACWGTSAPPWGRELYIWNLLPNNTIIQQPHFIFL